MGVRERMMGRGGGGGGGVSVWRLNEDNNCTPLTHEADRRQGSRTFIFEFPSRTLEAGSFKIEKHSTAGQPAQQVGHAVAAFGAPVARATKRYVGAQITDLLC